ncbi:MAG TPA: hypothetical protein VLX28_04650 [Thermoanaerobaculia bacterium]|nr:hypothetical protein [Thermoanaerobaculia bacterium]
MRILRLLGTSESLAISTGCAESLGWIFLISTTAILRTKLRELDRQIRGPKATLTRRRVVRDKRGRLGRLIPQGASREDTIDKLYEELRPLMSRVVSDPSLRGEVDAKLSHLRELQSEEADKMQKRFEAGLLLKPGEGWQALDRANELLARYENSPSPNPTTERHR